MLRKMIGKHNRILVGISVFCLLLALGCYLLMSFLGKEKPKKSVLVEELLGDCYFFSDKEVLSEMFSSLEEIRLVYGRNKSGVYETPEGVRYVAKEEKTISKQYPVYQKNGATVYLPETIFDHRFICSDFSLVKEAVRWVSYGAAFSENNTRAFAKDVFLIDFFDGIYMNTIPFIVEDFEITDVGVNSFVSFKEKEIVVLEFNDGVLSRKCIGTSGQTMISVAGEKVSYYNLQKFLKDAYKTEQPVMQKNGILLEGDYYYYFLSERYEISGPCYLYETKNGFLLESDEKSFLLPDCPLYDKYSSQIFLPRDYMLMQMPHHLFYYLPAMTKVKIAEEAIYVTSDDTISSYREIMLHDGNEHYVVLNEAILRLGTIELTISPLSCIYTTDEMELCFYQYDSEEFFSFAMNGKDAELVLANGDTVFLYDRLIRRKDGKMDLLQKDPSVFQPVQ